MFGWKYQKTWKNRSRRKTKHFCIINVVAKWKKHHHRWWFAHSVRINENSLWLTNEATCTVWRVENHNNSTKEAERCQRNLWLTDIRRISRVYSNEKNRKKLIFTLFVCAFLCTFFFFAHIFFLFRETNLILTFSQTFSTGCVVKCKTHFTTFTPLLLLPFFFLCFCERTPSFHLFNFEYHPPLALPDTD